MVANEHQQRQGGPERATERGVLRRQTHRRHPVVGRTRGKLDSGMRATICGLGLTLLLGAPSCAVRPFACDDTTQCRRSGRQGRCEPEGFCSYEDSDCPSGSRFSPNAHDSLADQCVEDDAAVDSTTTTGDDSTGGDTDRGPGLTGTQRWVVLIEGIESPADALGVAADETGPLVAGRAQSGDGSSAAFLVALDNDGNPRWGPILETSPTGRAALGVAKAGETILVAGVDMGNESQGSRGWHVRYDLSGVVIDSGVWNTPADDGWVAAVALGGTAALVGYTAQRGATWWLDDTSSVGEQASAAFVAADGRPDGAVAVLTQSGRFSVLSANAAPLVEGNTDAEENRAIAFAKQGGLYVGGRRQGRAWLSRWSVGGDLAWSQDIETESGNVVDIAVTLAGDLVVTGESAGTRWVRRLDASGTTLWVTNLESGLEPRAVATASDGGVYLVGVDGAQQAWAAAFAP